MNVQVRHLSTKTQFNVDQNNRCGAGAMCDARFRVFLQRGRGALVCQIYGRCVTPFQAGRSADTLLGDLTLAARNFDRWQTAFCRRCARCRRLRGFRLFLLFVATYLPLGHDDFLCCG